MQRTPKEKLLGNKAHQRTSNQAIPKYSSRYFRIQLQTILVADQFSKMPFIKIMKTVTSANCTEYFKAIFAVHGIPERLYTDNVK